MEKNGPGAIVSLVVSLIKIANMLGEQITAGQLIDYDSMITRFIDSFIVGITSKKHSKIIQSKPCLNNPQEREFPTSSLKY